MRTQNEQLVRERSPPVYFLFCKPLNQTNMKRFLFLFSLLSFITANSQITRHTWQVGGTGSFYSYNEDYRVSTISSTGKWTSIDLSASVGYFVVDKLSAGLRPFFSSFKGENTSGSSNYYVLAVGPFARYYFLKPDKQFNVLVDAGYQLGLNQRLGALHSKGKFNIFSVMAGPEIFFNSTAGMEILLGYSKKLSTIDDSPDAYYSNKKGLQVSLGFQLHLLKN